MTKYVSFSCGDSLDINRSGALQKRLLAALEKSSAIELKADKVVKVDTAGLQLFVSVKKEIETLGGKMLWKRPSEILCLSARRLGLGKHIGID